MTQNWGQGGAIIVMQVINNEANKRTPVILIADDDPSCLNVGIMMLQKLGYHVLDAKDGKEAISIFKENVVDLVILDMRMPHDGATTFYEMKQIDTEVKVLIASGYYHDHRIREMLVQGCNGFLQKPFNLNVLSQKIKSILNN